MTNHFSVSLSVRSNSSFWTVHLVILLMTFLIGASCSVIAANTETVKSLDENKFSFYGEDGLGVASSFIENELNQLSSNSASLPKKITHKITSDEVADLKKVTGIYEKGRDYNKIISGHGTGLRPPDDNEWQRISESATVLDSISSSNLPAAVDLSKQPWFPPIGDQSTQGSCTTWAVGYYTKTYQEAKENGWNVSNGLLEKLMSPSFIYNQVNGGVNEGSSFNACIDLVCQIGDCSLSKMPYNAADYTSWPSEQAYFEAPLYRGDGSITYISTDAAFLTNIKGEIFSGNPVVTYADADKFSSFTNKDMLTLDNYFGPSYNHAVTIFGYDDNLSYTEKGQTRYGAFKIANSWGIGGGLLSWERVPDGFYWLSYGAMDALKTPCMYYEDKIGYQP